MMRFRAVLVLFLLGAAIFASVVPRADSPETTFDESDVPVIVAPAEQPRIQFVVPALDLTALSPMPSVRVADGLSAVGRQIAPVSSSLHRPSLQNLLCTLLI
ncbi:MAG: hypothetical protein WAM78_08245 [Candidatus Sulfotelmatobacter sp.]